MLSLNLALIFYQQQTIAPPGIAYPCHLPAELPELRVDVEVFGYGAAMNESLKAFITLKCSPGRGFTIL